MILFHSNNIKYFNLLKQLFLIEIFNTTIWLEWIKDLHYFGYFSKCHLKNKPLVIMEIFYDLTFSLLVIDVTKQEEE